MKPYYQDNYVTIYHGDCRDILPELPKVDLVLTDPPYKTEYLSLYTPTFEACDKIMNDEAMCIALCGQNQLPFVMSCFPSSWVYIWCACYLVRGARVPIWPKGISAGWKPLLIYSKKPKRFEYWTMDVIEPSSPNSASKQFHEWGQDVVAFQDIIVRFGLQGLILDPFLGSGTTAIACKNMNRKCIGIEIEEKYCEIAAKRCSQSVMELNI